MRAKIFIRKVGRRPLPYDYQYFMAATLVHRQASENVEFSSPRHVRGEFKYYTFSYIRYDALPEGMMGGTGRGGLQFETGHFILSSPDRAFTRSMARELENTPNFYLGGVEMEVVKAEFLPDREFREKVAVFKMLSPLYIRTVQEQFGKLMEWELYPTDEKFYENVHQKLLRRYTLYHGREQGEHDFSLRTLGRFKAKRHTINNRKRRSSILTFRMVAPPELLKFGYEAGFGEETSMGFGCAEVVERRRDDRRHNPGARGEAAG